MDTTPLSGIGLTQGETKVYMALVHLGPAKTGILAAEAGVSSSKVYKILDRLERKGLVGHSLHGKTRHYCVLSPGRVLDYLDEREKELAGKRRQVEAWLPNLEKLREQAPAEQAAICQGFRAVTNLFRTMLDEMNAGQTYLVIGAGYGLQKGFREFFYGHHTRRTRKKIRVKMLANHDVRQELVRTTRQFSDIRYLPESLVSPMEIVVYHDTVFIVLLTESPTGFVLNSRATAESFRKYFDVLWKIAKP